MATTTRSQIAVNALRPMVSRHGLVIVKEVFEGRVGFGNRIGRGLRVRIRFGEGEVGG